MLTTHWLLDHTEVSVVFTGNNQQATNYSVTSIFQFTPLIESPKTYCPISLPTKQPTLSPTNPPTHF